MRVFIRHPSDIPIEIMTSSAIAAEIPHLRNVSLGGLCCKSTRFLQRGLPIMIRIPLITPPFEAQGKVVWCYRKSEAFELGIQFVETRDLFKVRMIEQICYIENYKQRVLAQEGRVLSSADAAFEWIGKYASAFPDPGQSSQRLN